MEDTFTSISELTDLEIIHLYLDNQQSEYFSELYNRYNGKVYYKCLSLLQSESIAKDATQEIFVKLFLNLSKFSEKAKFSTWVYSITYNYCIDYIRKKKRSDVLFSEDIEKAAEVVQEDTGEKELLEMEIGRLKKVLGAIPPGDKAILMMKYQDEMSIKEISQGLNKSESAIKMRLKRAKAKALQTYSSLFKHDL